ncbi:alpha/beta fold hydrolase [Frankia sp. CNm7]|uniref:Alpha/beta fold hydrolase n=1 Tax=Frankia nepalensis TaxID=1836974 RepID=A0A937R9Z5_9ACTN|nr:alpha/beta hydrolase [Frankia nepalensis]MBL7498657.1 alpha/beta fold hydrolase [Frankia nepalensis]MBL7509177.1 alpha/beta fold hydrolase [Frankia nepalensis]MBL7519118.1 alpha/beta fold hydrolase [Frankia nepalensis]MBL7628368.1 alpha/beta fold hydrolase [Frankia nepalensis]
MTAMLAPLRTLDLGDQRIAYLDRDLGAGGIPLVLLHGGGVDHRMWSAQLDAFPERRVLVPDARGHGWSSTPSMPYRLCDDVVALLDALEIDRAVLVGVSMGGGTAVDTALEHPDRVAGLVVSGTGTSEPDFQEPWVLDIQETWRRTEEAGDLEGWIEAFMRFVPGPRRGANAVEPDVTRLVDTMVRGTLATHLLRGPGGAPVPPHPPTPVTDTWARVPRIGVPVLAAVGALDGDDHLRMGRRLADSVPHGSLVTIDGTAHYPNMERPDAFNAAIAGFLATHHL